MKLKALMALSIKARVWDERPAAVQLPAEKLIILQKQVVCKRGDAGQRVILVDKSGGRTEVVA